MNVLKTSKLSRSFRAGDEEVWALRDVDLEVRAGEFVAVMGPSGSGKSTLISLLAGLESPTSGEVWLGGEPLHQKSDEAISRLRRTRVGFVFQSYNLVPVLTLEENIALPFLLEGTPPASYAARVAAALASVELTHRAKHLPDRVSGGERQRAAVARALVAEPTLIFADEPTGALDREKGQGVLTLLRRACSEQGRTVVMVTHDDEAARRADRIIRLRDGRLEAP
jgi:putative ABC transport system ATP-binding protein